MLALIAVAFGCTPASSAPDPVEAPGPVQPLSSEPSNDETYKRAEKLYANNRYAEAAPLFEQVGRAWLSAGNRDYTPWLLAAQSYAEAGQGAQAVSAWERAAVLPKMPSKERIPFFAPQDRRGASGWGVAETLRSKQLWADALAVYQSTMNQFPEGDGCVSTGASFQAWNMARGACLEQLGSYREAVDLYWTAALYAREPTAPMAMRRLVILYTAAGKFGVLQDAVARERKGYTAREDAMLGPNPSAEAIERYQDSRNSRLKTSCFAAYDRIVNFQAMARRHDFKTLVADLHFEPNKFYDYGLERDADSWARSEAYFALSTIPEQAVKGLAIARKRDPDNQFLLAAYHLCLLETGKPVPPLTEKEATAEASRLKLAKSMGYDEIGRLQREQTGFGRAPLQYPAVPRHVNLPEELPVVYPTSVAPG